MIRLTNNIIQHEGCILYQVARYSTILHAEEFGGYIEKELFKNLDKTSWIGKNSKIYNCPVINGKLLIHENVQISNSVLNGYIIIKNNTVVQNSSITCTMSHLVIEENAIVQNKHFAGNGSYNAILFNDGDFIYKRNQDVHVLRTTHYARVNCVCLPYEDAWRVLNSDALWKQMMHKHFKNTPTVFCASIREWLKDECWEGLQKLRQG